MAQGSVVDDATLATDVIGHVGPAGALLAETQTRRHISDVWRPGAWDRSPYEAALRGGTRGALENAYGAAQRTLAIHDPLPLPDDVAAELAAMVAHGDREPADRVA